MFNMFSNYQSTFSWRHPLNDYVVAHSDGQVSCYLSYEGIDPSLTTEKQMEEALEPLNNFLAQLPYELTCEFHFWRGRCRETVDKYLANSERTQRGHNLANRSRHLIAETLYPRSASNKVGIVLSMAPGFFARVKGLVSATQRLKLQAKLGNQLVQRLEELEGTLPGLTLETLDAYGQAVLRTYHRDYFEDGVGVKRKLRTSHPVHVQWASVKPDTIGQDHITKVGNTYCWSGLLKQTPNHVNPHWFYAFNQTIRGNVEGVSEIEVHISHVMQKSSASFSANKSERAAQKTQEANAVAGGSENRGKASDEIGFAYEVSDLNRKVFRHVYQVQLYSQDYEFLRKRVKDIRNWFAGEFQSAELVTNRFIAESVWRNAQPGMGYLNQFWRQHTHLYLSCMIPSVQFSKGSDNPVSLVLTQDGELMGIDYPYSEASHAMIAGKTGSGKGVRKSVEIIEFGSVGWDWYILEVGQTHRWTVESMGGTYIRLDPNHHVINPFPTYAQIRAAASSENTNRTGPPKELVTGTIRGIGFTLLGPGGFENVKKTALVHYLMVAETTMTLLYAEGAEREDAQAPNLKDYYDMMRSLSDSNTLNAPQQDAAQEMLNHLNSYLSTSVGQIFTQDNNISIEPGIVGIDFEPLRENEDLYKAFLTFACMRFGQLAFSTSTPSRVLLEEVHNTKGVDSKSVTQLARNVSLMGRKSSAAIELSGQDIGQFRFRDEAGSSDTESQIDYMQLFYTEKTHAEVAATYGLPDPVKEAWESFSNPKQHRKGYRDILLGMNGHWFTTLGLQPEFLLTFLSTDGDGTLEEKARISDRIPPEHFCERVEALLEWRKKRHLKEKRQEAHETPEAELV